MDFSDLDILDEFFGMGDDSNPFMMLIWMLPIILFVFYGQRIQLIITSRDIKKSLSELAETMERLNGQTITVEMKQRGWFGFGGGKKNKPEENSKIKYRT